MKLRITSLLFITAFLIVSAKAQICSGSLGDAVVNVTFGSGPNPGPSLPGAATSYFYISYDCPNDGAYTVINSTAGCFGNTWHGLTEDHTPNDVNGYMMLVNASIDTGDFYLDTVRGLCSGTTYEFSAWVVNVLKTSSCAPNPIHPKLVFNIETPSGQVLGTYSTGDIFESSTPVWKQYGLFFTTPLNTSTVVIRLTNNAPGGCGNDLALDDITFRPCGPSINVTRLNSTEKEVDLCINNVAPVSFAATVGSGYTAPALRWQETPDNGVTWVDIPGANTSSLVVNKSVPGKYLFRLTAAESGNVGISNCRVASNIVTVSIHDLPAVTASSNSPVCENSSLQLSAGGGSTYSWTGPAGFTSSQSSPSFSPKLTAAGQYNVTVTDAFGCINAGGTAVAITPAPVITTSPDQSFCAGNSAQLSASGGIKYDWSPSEGLTSNSIPNPVAQPAVTTTYQVVVSDAASCSTTGNIKLTVFQKPGANAGADKIIIKGNTVTLDGAVTADSVFYSWTPADYLSDPLALQPGSTPPADITYVLKAVSVKGCGTASDTMFIKVFNGLYIPTAFSPNGDGRNDVWRMEALAAYPNATVSLYNRFGQLVYRGKGPAAIWDGKYKGELAQPGAYVYMIDLKDKKQVLKGTLMLLR